MSDDAVGRVRGTSTSDQVFSGVGVALCQSRNIAMTPARKLAYRRLVYSGAVLALAFATMGLAGAIIPQGTVNPVIGSMLFLVMFGYLAYMI